MPLVWCATVAMQCVPYVRDVAAVQPRFCREAAYVAVDLAGWNPTSDACWSVCCVCSTADELAAQQNPACSSCSSNRAAGRSILINIAASEPVNRTTGCRITEPQFAHHL